MSLRSPKISIDKTDPFKECVLGRERYAEVLSELVKKHDDGMVLALDNPWGTGKTTFIEMWKTSLENQGLLTVYFNAWENDFEQNALTSILAELGELSFFKDENTDSFNDLIKRAGPLAKRFIPTLVKALVKKYTDDEFTAELFEGAADAAGEGLSKSMDDYATKKKGLKDFKEQLEELLLKVSTKPVVFFIDELDRCRPDYAVHTLEVMKHFFDVRGIVFILSIDKAQLEHAVKGVYGSEHMDASEYLRRFIDLEYSLPRPNNLDFVKFLYKHFGLIEYFESEFRSGHYELQNDGRNLIVMANLIFTELEMSLRQQEKTFANLKAALILFKENSFAFPELLLTLLYIRQQDKFFFEGIMDQQYEMEEIHRKLRAMFPENISSQIQDALMGMEARFLLTYHNSLDQVSNDFQLSVFTDELDMKLESLFCNSQPHRLAELIKSYKNNFQGGDLRITYLMEKISLLQEIQA